MLPGPHAVKRRPCIFIFRQDWQEDVRADQAAASRVFSLTTFFTFWTARWRFRRDR